MRRFLRPFFFFLGLGAIVIGSFAFVQQVQALAPCSITADTVINQAYIDSNACSSLSIDANVSTTWIGTVDLPGSAAVTVAVGNTMTMGVGSALTLGVTDDLVVDGTISHAVESTEGIQLQARNITVNVGGSIDATARGCAGGVGGGDRRGSGPDLATGICGVGLSGAGTVSGAGRGDGGAYGGAGGKGGLGGAASVPYGASFTPTYLGSGGGASTDGDSGGRGGGRVQLYATGVLTIDGTIAANGESPTSVVRNGGGGSGGSVYIRAGTVMGSGSISANGGSSPDGPSYQSIGGGGGGGRIAFLYTTLGTFSLDNIEYTGGLPGTFPSDQAAGQPGATYFLDRATDDGSGNIVFMGSFDFPEGDYSRTSIRLVGGSYFTCAAQDSLQLVAATSIQDEGAVWNCTNPINEVRIQAGTTLQTTSTSWTFSAATSVQIVASSWQNTSSTVSVTKAGSYAVWDIAQDLTLRNFTYTGASAGMLSATGGLLTIAQPIALTMVSSTIYSSVSSTLASVTIDERSSINATAMGCVGGPGDTEDATGPDPLSGRCLLVTAGYGKISPATGGGAAHAGAGGRGSWTDNPQLTTYGSENDPRLFGSGGGGGAGGAQAPGGNGGGLVILRVTGALLLNGSIRADGGSGVAVVHNPSGGGSGGSINIRAASLSGSGVVRATGGAGVPGVFPYTDRTSGGGGGGRIALSYAGAAFSGSTLVSGGAAGGVGADAGGSGSVYTLLLNTSPASPTSLAPTALVNGSTTGTTTPTFSFSLADPDGADRVGYRIQIDDTSNFSSPVVDYTSAPGSQGAQSFRVGQAQGSGVYAAGTAGQTLSDGSYYWRVKTIDEYTAESAYVAANGGAIAFQIDAAPRYLSFASSALSDAESVTATSVRILLSTPHFEPVTVYYSVSSTLTTASGSGVDYLLSSGTATIPAGQTSTTLSLVVVDDLLHESDETIGIELSDPTNAIIGSATSTIYTILDDDAAAPTLSPTGGGALAGGSGHGIIAPIALYASVPSLGVPVPVQPLSSRPLLEAPSSSTDVTVNQFIEDGLTVPARQLGRGERLAIVRDLQEILGRPQGRLPVSDLIRLAQGEIPQTRNLAYERKMSARALQSFRTLFGHAPNFRNSQENLAWNVLLYRIRFPRDLKKEQRGVQEFRRLFRQPPTEPFQWAVVRVLGYVKGTK